MSDYTVTSNDYLDARTSTWSQGTSYGIGHPWIDDEVLGRIRYDKATRLVTIAPTAVLVIHRLAALGIHPPR